MSAIPSHLYKTLRNFGHQSRRAASWNSHQQRNNVSPTNNYCSKNLEQLRRSKQMSQFKYRPKINSINDLQDGDEFLVGESRWRWEGDQLSASDVIYKTSTTQLLARDFIQAKVPVERDIPCPEGYELKVGDGDWVIPKGAMYWAIGRFHSDEGADGLTSIEKVIYAIPIPIIEFVGELHKALQKFDPRTKVRVTVLEEGE
jgi:hypothetical protein